MDELGQQFGAAGQADERHDHGQAEDEIEHPPGDDRGHEDDAPGQVPGLDDGAEQHKGEHGDAQRTEQPDALVLEQAVDGQGGRGQQTDGPRHGQHPAQAHADAEQV